jgi:hypothetical protein
MLLPFQGGGGQMAKGRSAQIRENVANQIAALEATSPARFHAAAQWRVRSELLRWPVNPKGFRPSPGLRGMRYPGQVGRRLVEPGTGCDQGALEAQLRWS